MSFIRPEARAALVRWREALAGLAVLALGLWWASGFGVLKWIGIALVALAAGLIVTGLQRARFRAGHGGPGVVRIDEGAVAYFGPLSGGVVAIRDLTRLELDGGSRPAVWVLRQPGQDPLHIPVTAEGADALFDAFTALPGLRTANMLAQLRAQPDHPVVIWEKQAPRLH